MIRLNESILGIDPLARPVEATVEAATEAPTFSCPCGDPLLVLVAEEACGTNAVSGQLFEGACGAKAASGGAARRSLRRKALGVGGSKKPAAPKHLEEGVRKAFERPTRPKIPCLHHSPLCVLGFCGAFRRLTK